MIENTFSINVYLCVKNKYFSGVLSFDRNEISCIFDGKKYINSFDWSTAKYTFSSVSQSFQNKNIKRAKYHIYDIDGHSVDFIDKDLDYNDSVLKLCVYFEKRIREASEYGNLEQERKEKEHQEAEARCLEEERKERERQEAEARRAEEERKDLERRLEEEHKEKERQEAEARRIDEERKEKERQEAETRRLEEERKERERQEAEARRLEEGRKERERQEAEAHRLEEERKEKERQEAEARRLEEERKERERQEAEARRAEEERKELERRLEEERREKERQEAEARRLEEERKEKERQEAEARRLEEERKEKERQEAETRRLEEERKERERQEVEAHRLEEERKEKERQEAEARRLEEERKERERQEAETRRLEEERKEKERQEAEARRIEEEQKERERQEAEARRLEEELKERERQEAEARRLEEERKERERQEAEARRIEKERKELEYHIAEAHRIAEERKERERQEAETRQIEEEQKEQLSSHTVQNIQNFESELKNMDPHMLREVRWLDSRWKTINNVKLYTLFDIEMNEIRDREIDDLKLSERLKKKLKRSRHESLMSILQMKISDVREIGSFGERSWKELSDFLCFVKYNKEKDYISTDNVIETCANIVIYDVKELHSEPKDIRVEEKEEMYQDFDVEKTSFSMSFDEKNSNLTKEGPNDDLVKHEEIELQEEVNRPLEKEHKEREHQEAEARYSEKKHREGERQEEKNQTKVAINNEKKYHTEEEFNNEEFYNSLDLWDQDDIVNSLWTPGGYSYEFGILLNSPEVYMLKKDLERIDSLISNKRYEDLLSFYYADDDYVIRQISEYKENVLDYWYELIDFSSLPIENRKDSYYAEIIERLIEKKYESREIRLKHLIDFLKNRNHNSRDFIYNKKHLLHDLVNEIWGKADWIDMNSINSAGESRSNESLLDIVFSCLFVTNKNYSVNEKIEKLCNNERYQSWDYYYCFTNYFRRFYLGEEVSEVDEWDRGHLLEDNPTYIQFPELKSVVAECLTNILNSDEKLTRVYYKDKYEGFLTYCYNNKWEYMRDLLKCNFKDLYKGVSEIVHIPRTTVKSIVEEYRRWISSIDLNVDENTDTNVLDDVLSMFWG